MNLSEDYDSLYDPRGRANLGEASSGKISGKISVKTLSDFKNHFSCNKVV